MKMPLRVLLDTNVYTTLLDRNVEKEWLSFALDGKAIFYGFSLIRRELRAIPAKKFVGKNYRNSVLAYYDNLVREHCYSLDSPVENLASQYLSEYSGGISRAKLLNDFRIVACAVIHGLDIVVTEDKHSLLSDPAKRSYRIVNQKKILKEPTFMSIQDFELTLRPV